MTVRVIPTSQTLSNYTQRVVLDGREYGLRLLWNQREAQWYLDLFDAKGDPIVYGVKVVVGFPLLRRLVDPRSPPGEIFAQDRSREDRDPGLRDFGTRVLLTYQEAADLLAAGV